VQGKIALPFWSAYSASKHAMQALADSLRAELSSSGVNVTIVHPGYVKTNLSVNALTGNGERHNQMDATTENGYTPEYVAEQIYKAVRNGSKEVLICSPLPRVAILLRLLSPRTFFYLMAWRAKKVQ
jgi:dehydrogenase/reductase SDR family protein 7B